MNTKIIRIQSVSCLTVVAFLLLTSCVKRDLDIRPSLPPAPDKGYAEIALDWSGVTTPAQTVHFLFYNESGALAQEVKGLTTGFRDSIPVGKYHIAIHNEDAQQVSYRGIDNYQTAEIFAQQVQGDPTLTDILHILEPKSVFGAGRFKEFETIEIVAGKATNATITPKLLTREVEFRFLVKSDVAVEQFKGVLNGVSPGIFLSNGKHNTASSCAIEFAAVSTTKAADKEYTTKMNVFNLLTTPESLDKTNTIDVTLSLIDGKKFELNVDLTPALKQIIVDNGGEIPIEIPVEVAFIVSNIGMTATVTPWDQSGTGGGDPRPQTVKK